MCIGFPQALLPAIRYAIDNKEVEWIDEHRYTMNATGIFYWEGCDWQIDEFMEKVEVIILRRGELSNQDLTALILKAKI